MMFIIVIILIIIYADKRSQYKKLLEENRKLRAQLKKIREQAVNQDEQLLEQYVETVREQPRELQQTISQHVAVEQKMSKEDFIRHQKEQKNVAILVTGAICIVLSAIVFLMSTWNLIPNILKTIVLSMLTLVFFGGSYIAKEKFKLEKASQTFFYIAMAYIPICLISISIFELFGNYLSIYGEGKFIYLMFASIFVAIIYYAIYMNNNSKYLLYGSVLSQVFGIISFSLIFSDNVLIIGVNLLLYNILLILMTRKDIFAKVYNLIPAIITFVAIPWLYIQDKTMIFMLMLLAINYLMLELKNSHSIYSYMFNISLMVFGAYTLDVFLNVLGTDTSYLLFLTFVLALYIIENMLLMGGERENLSNSATVVTLVTMAILHLKTFVNTIIIAPYVISILQIILLIITYAKSKIKGKNITSTLIPIYFIITGINIIGEFNCSYHAYIIFAFLVFVIGEMFRNRDKMLHVKAFIISHIWIVLTYLIVFVGNAKLFSDDVFYALLLMGIYIYSYLVDKNMIFKYLSYATSNLVLYTACRFFIGETEIVCCIPMVSTLLIMGMELIYTDLQDKNSDVYLLVSKFLSFAYIYSLKNSESITILAMIFAVILILDNVKNRAPIWNILPLSCVIPALFFNDFNTELEIGIMLLSVIAITGLSLKEKQISIFTIFSGIYLFLTSFNIESIYLKEILFICWAVVHFVFKTGRKEKDIFKFLSYLSGLFLYNSIIVDLGLETYTLFSMLGYILIAILTIRTILVKYRNNIDTLEYIVFGLIYFIALTQYIDEFDGMLFGILLVAIVIASYIKKYGALFMVSVFAILVNIFLLTREFWFSVPWWAYLLTIGTILIGFAIKNEMSDKKTEINAINLLKNIKDNIEKD